MTVSVGVAGTGRTPRQAVLFDELLVLFLSEGFAHFTLDDLALRLKCSKTTLYSLAESKDLLVRAVVVHFFRTATAAVEARLMASDPPHVQVGTYLSAVAEALSPAGPAFHRDLYAFPLAREVYERNTAIAAERVRQLVTRGVETGDFRPVHAVFIADTIAGVMTRIGRGEVRQATGLSDADAYRELSELVLHGISA